MTTAEEFWKYYKDAEESWTELPMEAYLNPFDKEDVLGYATAAAWALYDPEVEPNLIAFVHDIIDGTIFMTRSCATDAAYQWVADRYGIDAAEDLEMALDNQINELKKKRDAILEAEV